MMAAGGICLALAVISVFFASVVPGLELTFYAVSSVFTAIMVIETGLRGGIVFYFASVILCFIMVPSKGALLPYILFFGIYGIVKYLAERPENPVLQMILKTAVFAAVFGAGYIFFRTLFFGNINIPDVSRWILIIGALAGFLLYDFIFTLLIKFYRKRIKRDYRDIRLT